MNRLVPPTEPTPSPRCAACGSTDVVADAWASWDADERGRVVQAVFEHAECRNCGAETGIDWTPVKCRPEIKDTPS